MSVNVRGKTIWLTGASSGIGESLAYALNEKGAKLILSSRSRDALEKVRRNCSGIKENVSVLPLDLADLDSLPARAREAEKVYGSIDALVNNGGVSQRAYAVDTDFTVDETIMKTNYFGAVALTKAVLPGMLKRKSGMLVVVSSVMGKFGAPLRSGYAASKHALQGYFDSLRAEMHDYNIKILIVCPGYIRTNVSLNALKGDGMAHGRMDDGQKKGWSPEACAKSIVSAMEKEKREIYPGGIEIVGVYLNRFFPGLFSKIVRKVSVT